jgi:hypothetical protein
MWNRVRRFVVGVLLAAATMAPAGSAAAQTVLVEGPAGLTLPSPTPEFTLRALGVGNARPLRFTLQIATSAAFNGAMIFDSTIVSNDAVTVVQLQRLLPQDTDVYWRATVVQPTGPTGESVITGPRTTPHWITLVSPNSPMGDILIEERRPTFVWKSAPIAPVLGAWTYDVDVYTSAGQTEQSTVGLRDTTWTASSDLQSSQSYRWRVRATLSNGATTVANSLGSFLIKDQSLPLSTLLYQNFPNPFPSAVAFATCIWFDVAPPGARVSLQVTDLRGNLVRTLIPGIDGQRDFAPGRYGQGVPGTGSNCDNRFVWDGTGNDGRTVAAGVYLLRFQAGRNAPTFRRMLFNGR